MKHVKTSSPRRAATRIAARIVVSSLVGASVLAGCDQKSPGTGGNAGTPNSGNTGAGSNTTAPSVGGERLVMTTFYPTTYFAKRIAGGRVPVECPLPADADPIFWQPTVADLQRYQKAGLIVINGADFEKWVATAALPEARVVNTAAPFKSDFVRFKTMTHSHGAKGQHTHEGTDGHTWLDPINAKAQASEIAKAMSKRFPEDAAEFEKNLKTLLADLDTLDARFKALTPKLGGVTLLASHPAYNYLAKRYGLTIVNFDFDPESEISPEKLEEIAKQLPSITPGSARIMLWESQPLAQATAALEQALQIQSLVFSPAESLDADAAKQGLDYLAIMNANLVRLEKSVGAPKTGG